MTTLGELQKEIFEVYRKKGKELEDFSNDIQSLIDKGFSRDRALLSLALRNNIEIEEITTLEKSGFSEEEAILKFIEESEREASSRVKLLKTLPRETLVRPTPTSLWYLLPLAFGLLGGVISYVYVRDDDPAMAKNLFAFGLVVTIILSILFYLFLL